jgi:hypothetical protein
VIGNTEGKWDIRLIEEQFCREKGRKAERKKGRKRKAAVGCLGGVDAGLRSACRAEPVLVLGLGLRVSRRCSRLEKVSLRC